MLPQHLHLRKGARSSELFLENAAEVERVIDRNQLYFTLPCVRGIQATREFYTSMIPMKIIADALQPACSEVDIRSRCQRRLNKARVPIICRYIVDNATDYVLPSITVLVDSIVEFMPCSRRPSFATSATSRSQRLRANRKRRSTSLRGDQSCFTKRPELMHETVPCTLFIATTTEEPNRCSRTSIDTSCGKHLSQLDVRSQGSISQAESQNCLRATLLRRPY